VAHGNFRPVCLERDVEPLRALPQSNTHAVVGANADDVNQIGQAPRLNARAESARTNALWLLSWEPA
jgi:hypothetical protein